MSIIKNIIVEKKIKEFHKKFILSSAITFVVLVGSALAVVGPGSFPDFSKNMGMHSKSYSSHRVGLGDVIFFRFETTRSEINRNGGIRGKEIAIADSHKYFYVIAAIMLMLIFLYMKKIQGPIYNFIFLSIIPLFILTNPQINYYNLRIMLFLMHMEDPDSTRNRVGLILLFIVEFFTQMTKVNGVVRYFTTCTTSWLFLIYLLTMIGFFIKEYRKGIYIGEKVTFENK